MTNKTENSYKSAKNTILQVSLAVSALIPILTWGLEYLARNQENWTVAFNGQVTHTLMQVREKSDTSSTCKISGTVQVQNLGNRAMRTLDTVVDFYLFKKSTLKNQPDYRAFIVESSSKKELATLKLNDQNTVRDDSINRYFRETCEYKPEDSEFADTAKYTQPTKCTKPFHSTVIKALDRNLTFPNTYSYRPFEIYIGKYQNAKDARKQLNDKILLIAVRQKLHMQSFTIDWILPGQNNPVSKDDPLVAGRASTLISNICFPALKDTSLSTIEPT